MQTIESRCDTIVHGCLQFIGKNRNVRRRRVQIVKEKGEIVGDCIHSVKKFGYTQTDLIDRVDVAVCKIRRHGQHFVQCRLCRIQITDARFHLLGERVRLHFHVVEQGVCALLQGVQRIPQRGQRILGNDPRGVRLHFPNDAACVPPAIDDAGIFTGAHSSAMPTDDAANVVADVDVADGPGVFAVTDCSGGIARDAADVLDGIRDLCQLRR